MHTLYRTIGSEAGTLISGQIHSGFQKDALPPEENKISH